MASLAETMVQGAMQETDPGTLDIAGHFAQGAQIAQHAEQLQIQREQLDQQKQQLFAAKLEKVGGWYELGSKMPDGSAKQAFMKSFIPQGINALGLGDKINPTVQQMMQGDPTMGAFLKAKVQDGSMQFPEMLNALGDPAEMAKLMPAIKQFGDEEVFRNTMSENMGGLAEAHRYANTEEGKLARSTLMANAQGAKVGVMQDNMQTAKDRQAADAVSKINKDPDLEQFTKQSNAITRGKTLLNDPNKPVSVTVAHEILQDYAAALTGKGIATDAKLASITPKTMQENTAKLLTFIESDPNQPAPPKLVDFLRDMGDRLEGAYDKQIAARSRQLKRETKVAYAHNKNAVSAAEDTAKAYETGSWKLPPGTYQIGTHQVNEADAKEFYTKNPQFLTPDLKKELGL